MPTAVLKPGDMHQAVRFAVSFTSSRHASIPPRVLRQGERYLVEHTQGFKVKALLLVGIAQPVHQRVLIA